MLSDDLMLLSRGGLALVVTSVLKISLGARQPLAVANLA